MSRAEHPLIAVNGLLSAEQDPRLVLSLRYADSVLKAGGVPVAVPPVGGPGDARRLLESVDGLLLGGGDDFAAEPLGLGATHPAANPVPRAKQDFDLVLARAALDLGLPVLGICYGMQLLGLVEGAGLHQHLPDDLPGCPPHSGDVEHGVRIEPGSKLASLLGVEELGVVSRHHQALSSVRPPWRVAARDSEGLIEAIEREGHAFAIGVQWHPELSYEGSPHDALFRGLVGAAALSTARRETEVHFPS